MCISGPIEILGTACALCYHRLTLSHFAHIGKKSAWKVWETHDQFTRTFYDPNNSPEQISEEAETSLEYIIIVLYDKTSVRGSINKVRKLLFTRKGHQMSALPLYTKAVLEQHIRRAALQGLCWGCTTIPYRQLPSPAEWGWTFLEQWRLRGQICLDKFAISQRILVRAVGVNVVTLCVQASLKYTIYCTCGGDCGNA